MIVKDIQENYGAGWIKVYRSIKTHWIWQDDTYFKMWIDFLMRANHQENDFMMNATLMKVPRGSFVTSLKKLAKEYNCSIGRIRHFLNILKSDNMIEPFTTHKYTQITICNYEDYQNGLHAERNQNEIRMKSERNQNETNKNVKNDKNENNIFKPLTIEERMTEFELAVMEYKGEYPKELLQAFWDYWSEPNPSRTKMRKELQKTWDTQRRLKTWQKNNDKFGANNGTNGTEKRRKDYVSGSEVKSELKNLYEGRT